MDGNYLLTWLVAVSSGLALVRTLSAHRRPSIFAALNAVTLAVLGLGLWLLPEVAGFVAGGVWAVLILVPSLLHRRASSLAVKRRYREAARIARMVQWIHPAPSARRSMELFEALADDREGNTQKAIESLNRLAEVDPGFHMPARVWAMIMARRWPELREWLARRATGTSLLSHPLAAAGWLRALGETGDLAGLVRFHAEVVEQIGVKSGPAWLSGMRMMALSYLGQPALVASLAESGQLGNYPPSVRRYWRAIALQAAGRVDAARPILEELVQSEPGSLGAASGDRLSYPARVADEVTQQVTVQGQLGEIRRAAELAGRFGSLAVPPRTRVAAVTLGIVVANIVVFGFELKRGGSTDGRTLYEMGALVTPVVEMQGEWWRVVTAAFLHYGWLHLAMNMAALLFFGRYLEAVIGHVRYGVLYALAAPGSMALILVGRTAVDAQPQLVVGASGGVMAVLGAVAAVMWTRWRHYRAPMAKRDGVLLATLVGFQVVFDMLTPQVSGLGHASGALLGFLLFWPLARSVVAPRGAEGG